MTASARQLAISFSCSELNWSAGLLRQDRLLQPVPLHDGRLEQRGRRVGVVLEELRRAAAVEREIEAAEKRRIARMPRCGNVLTPALGNRELGHPFADDDVIGGVEAARMQLRRRGFQRVDLLGGEAVAARFIPVGPAERMDR